MTAQTFSLVAIILGGVQIALGFFWVFVERNKILVRWLTALLVLLGALDLVSGIAWYYPLFQEMLSLIYAAILPLAPVVFTGAMLALIKPEFAIGRTVKAITGLGAVLVTLSLLDIYAGTGYYYTGMQGLNGPTSSLLVYLSGPVYNRLVPLFPYTFFASFLILGLAVVRDVNPEQRSAQIIMGGALLFGMVVRITVASFLKDAPIDISFLTISVGIFVVMTTFSSSIVLDRLGAMIADQSILNKLLYSFGFIIVVLLVIGFLSIISLTQLNAQVEQTLLTQNQLAGLANSLMHHYREAREHERDFALRARTTGIQYAIQNAYPKWDASVQGMGETLEKLKGRVPRDSEQRALLQDITSQYEKYVEEARNLFERYEERGDLDGGRVAEWLQAAEKLDVQIRDARLQNRDFTEKFVALRTNQFYYLASARPNQAEQIQQQYEELQRLLLYSNWDIPTEHRTNTQILLGQEAQAFQEVLNISRSLTVLRFNLEQTSGVLLPNIEQFTEQANQEFNQGVTTINNTRGGYVVMIAVVVALGFLLAWLLTRVVSSQIAKPVLVLADTANKMASGELNVRATASSKDELGIAAQAFNTMAARLQGLLNTLEERVQQRTMQLETAAQVAASANERHDLTELLNATTTLLVEQFEDVYHAQVFLLEQQNGEEWAVLRASSGEVGQQLLELEHKLKIGSQSVIGQVAETGKHLLARTTDPYSVHKPNKLLPETKAELAVPMKRRGRVTGALDVQSTRHYAFNEDDVKVFQVLADQLAVAVDNARLFANLGTTIEETELLFRSSAGIASATERQEIPAVFGMVAESVGEIDRLSILLFDQFDKDGRPLHTAETATWTPTEGLVDHSEFAGMSAALWVLIEQRIFEIRSINQGNWLPPALRKALEAAKIISFALLPLQTGDQHLGMLVLQRKQAGEFPEQALRIYRALAQQAAVALNRFALLDQLSTQVDELQELRTSFLDLGSSTSLDVLLQTLAERAAFLVDAHSSAIYLYDESQNLMRLVTVHNIEHYVVGAYLEEDEGAAGRLISSREPLLVDNYALWEGRATDFPGGDNFGSLIAIPLIWQNRLIGALSTINQLDQRHFTQDDLRRLALFADQAALTIENTRLLDETERSLQETEALYKATHGLMSTTTEDEMLATVVNTVGADSDDIVLVVRALLEESSPALIVAAVNDREIVIREAPEKRILHATELFPAGATLPPSFLLVDNGSLEAAEARIANDLPGSSGGELLHVAQQYGFRSLMTIPISTRHGFYGAILTLRRDEVPFQSHELTRYSTVASQFAVAHDNIRLLEESQGAAAQLAAAAEVSRAATEQLDVNDVLTRSVELVREKFGYYHVQVFLLDEARIWAELRASTGDLGRQLLEQKHRLPLGSRSVVGQAAEQGRPIVARTSDLDEDSMHQRNELLVDTKVELALPMKIGDQVIGAMDVQSTNPDEFEDEGDVSILQTLADQLAVAVQNARLFEGTQESLKHNQDLYNAGRTLSAAETLDQILDGIQSHVAPDDVTNLSILSVLADEEGESVELRVDAILIPGNSDVEMVGHSYTLDPKERFLIERLGESRETLVVHDVKNDYRLDQVSRDRYNKMGVGALLLVPLTIIEGRPLWLYLSLPTSRHITRSEVERLGTIGAQAGIAIENLHLLNSLEERARRLSATNLLTSKLLTTASLDEMLSLGATELCAIMEVDQVNVALYDQARRTGRIVVQHRKEEQEGETNVVHPEFPMDDNAAVEWMERARQPLPISNVQNEPIIEDLRPLLESQGVTSVMLVPLFIRGEMIGSIGLDIIAKRRVWSEAEISLALNVSNLLAAAIESTRLFEQISRTLQQTQALYRASRAINEADTVQEIAEAVALHVVNDPEATTSIISFTLTDDATIRRANVEATYSSRGNSDELDRMTVPAGGLPFLRELNVSREPLVINDIGQASELSESYRAFFEEISIRALMAAPIRMPDGWSGMILVTFPTVRSLTHGDLDRLTAIATQAATTMQNRELLLQTQKSLLESQLMYQAGASINEAESLEDLLSALEPLAERIDPDQTVLLLFNEPVREGTAPSTFTTAAGLNHREELMPIGRNYDLGDTRLLLHLPMAEPIVYEDLSTAEGISEEEVQLFQDMRIRALLYLPLRIGSRYIGWIAFHASRPRRIHRSAILPLQNIVQQAAIALQSQQLLQDARRRAWHEEQISRITTRLFSSTDPEEIMRIGLQELKQTLNLQRAMAWVEGGDGSNRTAQSDSNGHGTTNGDTVVEDPGSDHQAAEDQDDGHTDNGLNP